MTLDTLDDNDPLANAWQLLADANGLFVRWNHDASEGFDFPVDTTLQRFTVEDATRVALPQHPQRSTRCLTKSQAVECRLVMLR